MKLPSLPLFTDTFIAETAHLTNEQIGIYMRLLCFAWTKKGKPFTREQAYRIGQCGTVGATGDKKQANEQIQVRWSGSRIDDVILNVYVEEV